MIHSLLLVALVAGQGAQSDSVQKLATPRDTTPRTIGPAVRRISTASAVSTEQIGNITSVRELSGGRLLLNDGSRRRLLMMDSTLKTISVVLDSLTEVANAYGVRQGALIPYRGDSSLFLDPASFALLVLDGDGRIARVDIYIQTEAG